MKRLILTLGATFLLAACTPTTTNSTNTTGTGAANNTPTASQIVTPTTTADDTSMVAPTGLTSTKTIQLEEQTDSGQTGTVEIKDVAGKAVVTITMKGTASTVPQPAHIHMGQCPKPGAVKYPLTNVVNGKSVTTLDVDLATLWQDADDLAINVHKSAQEQSVYTACGNLEA